LKELDGRYNLLRKQYVEAMCIIMPLEADQYKDKRLLKLATDEEIIKILRLRIRRRRQGPLGLRSLNRKIFAYYKYCEENNIWVSY